MTAISANLQILLVFTCSSAPTRSSRRLHSLSTKPTIRHRSQTLKTTLSAYSRLSQRLEELFVDRMHHGDHGGGGHHGLPGVSKMSDELSSRPHSNVSSVHPPHGLVEYIYSEL
ncbi:hypothetical protein TNCT_126191 [Trichonephila clavata]|uniref:Uncharacterized protein n=1 Tax=Trichonephila clavata TaxID=2740835 RepID=A0A8X6LEK0_TRICU|nr:hypothetical protein TNCT_126191 [Trichonephila clavata]